VAFDLFAEHRFLFGGLIGAALVVSEIWIDIVGFVEVSEMAFLCDTTMYVFTVLALYVGVAVHGSSISWTLCC
jgi:hypothetical protein